MKNWNRIRKNRRGLRFVAILAGLLALTALPAFSQSCALCYTQASLAGSKTIQALKSGILILVIPPTLASVGMFFVLRHKNNQVRQTESDEANLGWSDRNS
jgi:hypothetical protein